MNNGLKTLLCCALLATTVFSCRNAGENDPHMLSVMPKETSLPGYGHNAIFKISCDKDIEVDFADGRWASLVSKEPTNVTNQIEVTVKIELNPTGSSRVDTLKLKSGSMTAKAVLKQLSLKDTFGASEITLTATREYRLDLKLAGSWTLDIPADAREWLSVSPTSGSANVTTTVIFKALNINNTSNDRSTKVMLSVSGTNFEISVTQPSGLPAKGFDTAAYGIYNFDGGSTSICYDRYNHQLCRIAGSRQVFRIICPSENKYMEFSGLPDSYKEGDEVKFTLKQNFSSVIEADAEVTAYVFNIGDDCVRLVSSGNIGYVIAR